MTISIFLSNYSSYLNFRLNPILFYEQKQSHGVVRGAAVGGGVRGGGMSAAERAEHLADLAEVSL